MTTKTKLDELKACYDTATQCGDHPDSVTWKLDEVVEVLHVGSYCNCGWGDSMCGSYCDSGSVAVVRLKDGRYGTVQEDSDTTGHG